MTGTPDLWTVDQVAAHWRVSKSRAWALLAEYGIQRVSGYPASDVQEVQRPGQGRRTDLER